MPSFSVVASLVRSVEVKFSLVKSEKGSDVKLCVTPCYPFFEQCLSFMDMWDVITRLVESESFRGWVTEGIKNFKNHWKPFLPESVDLSHGLELSVEQRATILNDAEFLTCMKKTYQKEVHPPFADGERKSLVCRE